MNTMLSIKNLHAQVAGKPILNGIDLEVRPGEVHAIMGPNGSGKSTLANVLAGRENYEVTRGEILYKDRNLLDLSTEERACEGIFLDCNTTADDGCESDPTSDPLNCGGCNQACDLPNVEEHVCADGVCGIVSCVAEFEDCNLLPDDGCEADTLSDTEHCGDCNNPCLEDEFCVEGTCGPCTAGEVACDGVCTDVNSDPLHCSGCARPASCRPRTSHCRPPPCRCLDAILAPQVRGS